MHVVTFKWKELVAHPHVQTVHLVKPRQMLKHFILKLLWIYLSFPLAHQFGQRLTRKFPDRAREGQQILQHLSGLSFHMVQPYVSVKLGSRL